MIDVYLWSVYIMHRLQALLAHKNTFLSCCGSNKLHDIHHCPRAFAGLTCVSPPLSGLSYQQYTMGAGYVMVLGLHSTPFSSNLLKRSEQ